jgi:AcrR family transcriptional regulator
MKPEGPAKSPRKSPSQERSKGLVDSILEAAARVLGASPDDPRFTTNHLAQIAGVSIGSLYQYFPGKEAIVAALAQRRVRETYDALISEIENAHQRGDSLKTAIEHLIDRAIAMKVANDQIDAGVIAAVVRHNLTKEAFLLDREYVTKFAKAIEPFKDQMREGIDLETAAHVIFHSLRSTMVLGSLERSSDHLQDLRNELVHLVTAYLST